MQKFGGDKSEELTCSKCNDCECSDRVSKGSKSQERVNDINCSHDLCAYAKVVDVSDNEICLIDCTNNVFGVYSHCFFVNNHFSRRYEIIGTEGIIYIELGMREAIYGCDGRITLAKNNPAFSFREEYKFGYAGKIHYNGGPFAGRHFYKIIKGEAEPLTRVQDAFAAEMVGIGAMRSSKEKRSVDIVQEIVPEDLHRYFKEAYSK